MSFISPDNYELGLITKDITDKKTYYANNYGNVIKIYKTAPAIASDAQAKSLYDLVTDDITGYEMVTDPTPEGAVPFYVISEDIGEQYKISENPQMYVLPSLSLEQFETKVEAEKKRIEAEAEAKAKAEAKEDADRLERERVEEKRNQEETERLAAQAQEDAAKAQAQEDAAQAKADEARLELERLATVKPAQVLPPPPPSVVPLQPPTKEEEETARINEMLSKYKTDTSKRKGLPNSTTSGGVSVSNACYINAMLQMLIDIDEFLNYILFMNESDKDSELADLVGQEADNNEDFLKIVKSVGSKGDANIEELLILVYNFVTDENNTDLPNFSNLNKIQLIQIQTLLNFTTDINNTVITKIDIKDNTGNKTEKHMSEDQVNIYKKYYDIAEIDSKATVFPVLELTEIISSLEKMVNIKTKKEVFETKHEIIQQLKQVFEYVIDETSTNKTKTIQAIQDIQTKIGVKVGVQDDAAAIYGLLNVVFDAELHQKYGVYVKGELLSPYNLQQNHGKEKMSDIIIDIRDIGIKEHQTNIIIGNQYVPQITVDTINLNNNRFSVAGIVQHLGGSTASGATGGHYIYYSFKTGKTFNDESVSQLNESDKSIKHTNFVALYERFVDLNASTSAASGGSRKTFRVSRRKQVRHL